MTQHGRGNVDQNTGMTESDLSLELKDDLLIIKGQKEERKEAARREPRPLGTADRVVPEA